MGTLTTPRLLHARCPPDRTATQEQDGARDDPPEILGRVPEIKGLPIQLAADHTANPPRRSPNGVAPQRRRHPRLWFSCGLVGTAISGRSGGEGIERMQIDDVHHQAYRLPDVGGESAYIVGSLRSRGGDEMSFFVDAEHRLDRDGRGGRAPRRSSFPE